MNKNKTTEIDAKALIKGKLSRYFGVAPSEATREQIYKAVVMSVRDIMLEKRQQFHIETKAKKAKRVYYLCMEFLLGRSLKNSVFNLGVKDVFEEALKPYDVTLSDLYELEPDAGLGNGGLGRLAACFLDALASGDYPAMGFSIRYEYGLFKQKNHRGLADGASRRMASRRRSVADPAKRQYLYGKIRRLRRVKMDGARSGDGISQCKGSAGDRL